MGIDLPLIWAVIILFGIMMYVLMDGFDLGIGVLYPFFPVKEDRDVMMNTVAPVWDGNETWLVLGGAGLLAAFPLAYSIILSALYLPLIFMLIGLIFRGVAFEFRFKAHEHERHVWDKAFFFGSLAATFFQGVAMGAYVQGIAVLDHAYAGGAWDWITPFSIFTGVGLVAAYALLGSTWLIMKTEGSLQKHAYAMSKWLIYVLLVFIAAISFWTPFIDITIAHRWFSFPNIFWFAPVPVLVMMTAYRLHTSINQGHHRMPFICTLFLIFLGYSGLGISVWPNIIPFSISIAEASSPAQSQGFALVGALMIIPIILVYTAWSYYVFRGKVRPGEAYH
jgi:cytochrome d ubiquinol oxidase subunit II